MRESRRPPLRIRRSLGVPGGTRPRPAPVVCAGTSRLAAARATARENARPTGRVQGGADRATPGPRASGEATALATAFALEWTGATSNPTTACSRMTSGCKNCYAERLSNRLKAMGLKKYAENFGYTEHEVDSSPAALAEASPHIRQQDVRPVSRGTPISHSSAGASTPCGGSTGTPTRYWQICIMDKPLRATLRGALGTAPNTAKDDTSEAAGPVHVSSLPFAHVCH